VNASRFDAAGFGIALMRQVWRERDRAMAADGRYSPLYGEVQPKREEQFRRYVEQGDYLQALGMADRPAVIPIIEGWYRAGALDAVMLNQALAKHWSRVEFPSQFGKRKLVRLFRAAGFVTDTEGTEPPTAPLVVYRGCGDRFVRGLSWTTDLDSARWFAARFAAAVGACLCVAEIPPEHVLGLFHWRREAEVIVDPARLRRLRVEPPDLVTVSLAKALRTVVTSAVQASR
jgi:hypothetical protein